MVAVRRIPGDYCELCGVGPLVDPCGLCRGCDPSSALLPKSDIWITAEKKEAA